MSGPASDHGQSGSDPAVCPRAVVRGSAICDAALELLAEVGYDRMSMDAVAARAHASKATIYRRWAGKREMVLEAVRSRVTEEVGLPDTGSLRGDVIGTLRSMACGIGAADAALMAGVLRAMRTAPELADCMRTQVIDHKRYISKMLVDRAIERGELGPRADPGVFHEVAPALMFFRVLVCAAEVDDAFLAHVTDDVLIPLLQRSADCSRQEKE